MDPREIPHDRPSIPLTVEEGRTFAELAAAATRDRHRRAFSRFIAHLTPATCRWLSDLSVPERMWRSSPERPGV
ncbi:hypothetical protein ACQEU5_19030 [Marinactinospora thermotolerans]|uniref:Uncharacterized protein n=1 Tax=Marinactinospora thermotolerans DSM 45154 TaxID=1122192 RepID=A0A1T4NFF5_9ACTN|nr:hypothetical protein [Marinactinospora thermotolerans]SJZ78000.1 hypothetical protein SAMN02745673_01422 [Marinactinospora thermotolerans DSM 45154]